MISWIDADLQTIRGAANITHGVITFPQPIVVENTISIYSGCVTENSRC